MSTKKFGGFTEEQMSKIAQKMGHSGPMEKFNDFLNENPDRMTTLSRMTDLARGYVEEVPHMAGGGSVKKTKKTSQSSVKNTGFNMQKLTDTALNNPNQVITPVKTTPIQNSPNQYIDPKSGQVSANAPQATQNNASTTSAQAAPQTDANTVTTATTEEGVNQATEDLQGVHGTVSDQAQVEAQTALPSADATVQGQMSKLMEQFQGGQTPPWAAGALRKANELAASRGLGSSSIALSASTQAAMESALGIAIQDAQTYSQFEMQNLNNRQQAALVNAQSFLQMDLANLNNDQTAMLMKTQLRTQALFTDAAAENASRQFNATSENQTDQFFASLKTQVAQFNAAQKNATSQFNAGQKNATSQFNTALRDQREQFNAQNRLIIDQSNVQWRRQIATTDNANINEANRINAQAATGLTSAAYNNLWQKERDLMAFAFTASENDKQRAHDIVLAKKQSSSNQNNEMWKAAGSLVSNIVDDIDFGGFF
jgi:hypothetical protein